MLRYNYPLHSRVHRLRSFDTSLCTAWVKRDDELGFGITGTKFRKYRSLVPFLVEGRFDEVALIGGANSNHIVGLIQLLREERLPFRLYLRGEATESLRGNRLLTTLIAGSSIIRWIARRDWPHVYEIAQDDVKSRKCFIIPEGAFCQQALPGAMTLADDILANERELKQTFSHVFLEAGTGLSAMALLQGLRPSQHIHIVLLAGTEEEFLHRLKGLEISVHAPYTLHRPSFGRSFGSVGKAVLEAVQLLAHSEGILTDPIYSAKLFLTAKELITSQKFEGQALIIHGGGGLALAGFQEQLAQVCRC